MVAVLLLPLPKILKPTAALAVLLGTDSAVLAAVWLKAELAKALVGPTVVAGFPNWKRDAVVPVEGVVPLEEAPNRKGWDDTVVTAVVVLGTEVEAGMPRLKLNTGVLVETDVTFMAVEGDIAVVTIDSDSTGNPDDVLEVVVDRSAAGWGLFLNAKKDAVVAGGATVASGGTLPKMGLNVLLLVVTEGGAEDDTVPGDVATAKEVLPAEKPGLSIFVMLPKIGLNTDAVLETEDTVDVVVAVSWLAGGLVSIPKRMLGFGAEEGLDGVWPKSDEVVTKLLILLVSWTAEEEGGAKEAGVLNVSEGLASVEVTDAGEPKSRETAGAVVSGVCVAEAESERNRKSSYIDCLHEEQQYSGHP